MPKYFTPKSIKIEKVKNEEKKSTKNRKKKRSNLQIQTMSAESEPAQIHEGDQDVDQTGFPSNELITDNLNDMENQDDMQNEAGSQNQTPKDMGESQPESKHEDQLEQNSLKSSANASSRFSSANTKASHNSETLTKQSLEKRLEQNQVVQVLQGMLNSLFKENPGDYFGFMVS